MSELAIPLGGLLLLLALSGFFSGSETALMAVNRHRLGYLAQRGDRRAALVRQLVAMPERLLSTILVGNNFANVAASALATVVCVALVGEGGVLIATGVMTALILVCSEIAPKTLAARFPERMAFLVARPISVLVRVLDPLASAAVTVANVLLIPWGRPHPDEGRVSEEDIKGMILLGEEERVIAREKRRMLHGIFRLTETTIEDIMIPRTQMVALEADAPPEDVVETIRRSGNTRLPVYEGTLDRVVGVLHSKDVIGYLDRLDELDLRAVARKPFFVPETATLESLLRTFQRQRQHLAIVIDEYGGVEGIVSLEDLLEEIVGDIEDEYDEPQRPQVVELDDGVLHVDGTCPLSLLRRRYGLLQLESEEASTLAGFLMEITGRVPKPGERIEHGGVVFIVRRARQHRVDHVRIEPGAADVEPGGRTAGETDGGGSAEESAYSRKETPDRRRDR